MSETTPLKYDIQGRRSFLSMFGCVGFFLAFWLLVDFLFLLRTNLGNRVCCCAMNNHKDVVIVVVVIYSNNDRTQLLENMIINSSNSQ